MLTEKLNSQKQTETVAVPYSVTYNKQLTTRAVKSLLQTFYFIPWQWLVSTLSCCGISCQWHVSNYCMQYLRKSICYGLYGPAIA